MTEIAELKPCPFCGGQRISMEKWTDGFDPHRRITWIASCTDCSARTGYHEEEQADAIEAWNRRAALATPDDGWLPIESAPKDGHHFLAYCEDTVDEYDEDRLLRRGVKERYTVVAYWLWGQFVQFPFTGSIVQNRVFTHWRPLPAPPANGRGE